MNSDYPIRINRYLSDAGLCSRRAADRLIEEGRVSVNGLPAGIGLRVMERDSVCVDGKPIMTNSDYRVFAFYKPAGFISSLSDEQGKGIAEFTANLGRVYPVGRLDKDSEGLMLLTNDGMLMNEILKAAGNHEKEYLVGVNRDITTDFLERMASGVPITNRANGRKTMTAPCRIIPVDDRHFRIVLIQGLNRQIRRMCGYFSYQVTELKRIRIMNVMLDGMEAGQIRNVTGRELEELRSLCKKI